MQMLILKSTNLAVRFLLELGAFGALGYWGFHLDRGLLVKVAAGIGAPLLAAVLWGTFVAPKAAVPVSVPVHLLLQVEIFGIAVAALIAAGRPALAWWLGMAKVVNGILMHSWGQ
jgi:hypothetical protein